MPRFASRAIRLLLIGGIALAILGCTPTAYRIKADREAYRLIWENAMRTRDPLADYSVYVDPRSRMYDPYDPDFEPMPPDDPASHEYMHWVDGMKASKHWHDNGDTPYVQNPDWQCYLPLDSDGCLVLDSDQALAVAYLNSRDYQTQLEQLYLSALDVSFERFRFDAQFFNGDQTQYTADGPERPGGGGQSSSQLLVATLPANQEGLVMRKMFATGGQLVVGLANAVVWEFSGPDTHVATTLANFAFVQPLLRNGGKIKVLERLTISERTLLANVRQMQRYRRGFYVSIITGQDTGAGPSRRGGVFGGAGLEGFTGIGGGGFGRLTTSGASSSFSGGAGAGQAGGYFGLLQLQQNLRNLEFNVASLRGNLQRLKAISDAQPPDPAEQLRARLQVEQAQQALYTAQSQLLNAKLTCQNNFDAFKITLGLPPDLCIKVRDPLLDPFKLIDDEVITLQNRLTEIQQEIGQIQGELLDATRDERGFPRRELPWRDEYQQALATLQRLVAEMADVRKELRTMLDELETQSCAAAIAERRSRLTRLREVYRTKPLGTADPCLNEEGEQRLRSQVRDLLDVSYMNSTLAKLRQDRVSLREDIDQRTANLDAITANLDKALAAGKDMQPDELYKVLFGEAGGEEVDPGSLGVFHATDVLADLSVSALGLSLVMAKQRAMCIDLTPVDLQPDVAIEIARANRRDWMNARANLVDTWRLIQFNANDLLARFDIIFEGDIQNVGNQPFNLQGTAGRLRARAELDTPLTRLAERNAYRQALIEYQAARRGYYAYTDQVDRSLRSTLRGIEINEINFEARRRAVLAAIDQVVTNRLIQDQPSPPGEVRQVGVTAARDAVSALTDLLNAQNDFLSVWVNFEVLRRTLDRDLGTMQLDARGNWIDPGNIGANTGFLLPADCDDCREEAELFNLPLPGDEIFNQPEELPPGDVVNPPAGAMNTTADRYPIARAVFNATISPSDAASDPPPSPAHLHGLYTAKPSRYTARLIASTRDSRRHTAETASRRSAAPGGSSRSSVR